MPIKPENVHDNPFKARNNNLLTQALFLETIQDGLEDRVLWTLAREPKKGYPSLYQKYMELADPTEYEISKLFYSWEHWKQISEHRYIKKYIDEYREELAQRLFSEAVAKIKEEAKGGKNAYQAAKYLAERGWEKPAQSTGKRGRPRKTPDPEPKESLSFDPKEHQKLIPGMLIN